MPRVDFYILSDENPSARDLLSCRLAEKACKQGHRVYLHAESEGHARQLDELLWTFRAGSFLPHALLRDNPQPTPPVLIGSGTEAPPVTDVLINLAAAVPDFFGQFTRIAEIVDPAAKEAGRTRFRFYRDHGCHPESHNIS